MPKCVRIRVVPKEEPDLARFAAALLALIRAKQEQDSKESENRKEADGG